MSDIWHDTSERPELRSIIYLKPTGARAPLVKEIREYDDFTDVPGKWAYIADLVEEAGRLDVLVTAARRSLNCFAHELIHRNLRQALKQINKE